jgi:hypothetical protein
LSLTACTADNADASVLSPERTYAVCSYLLRVMSTRAGIAKRKQISVNPEFQS